MDCQTSEIIIFSLLAKLADENEFSAAPHNQH